MPTYDYECKKCNEVHEIFHSIMDESAKKCPDCKAKMKRKISAGAGIIFKGSGFYETDYRSDSYVKGKKGEEAAQKSSSESSKDKKSDAKAGKTDSGSTKSETKKPAAKKSTKSK